MASALLAEACETFYFILNSSHVCMYVLSFKQNITKDRGSGGKETLKNKHSGTTCSLEWCSSLGILEVLLLLNDYVCLFVCLFVKRSSY